MTSRGRKTVVIADDHPVVLRGLQGLIEGHEDFTVVAGCSNGREALESIRQSRPNLAVIDINMPEMDGVAVLAAISAERLPTRVVLLAASVTDQQIFAAVTAGAHGLLLKESAPEVLIRCLREVATGRRWLPQEIVRPAIDRETQRRRAGRRLVQELSARELEIVRLVGDGLSNKAIARRLSVAEGTIKNHLHNIYQKLVIGNRAALARLAAENKDQFTS